MSITFSPMRWTEEHDIVFLRELLVHEPYKYRKGSTERGKVWDKLATALNKIEDPKFRVHGRSVRDHLKTLVDNFKRKNREEEKASGISPEESEVDTALSDIVERFEQAEEEHISETSEKKAKIAMDMEKAQEMRKRSLETFAETNERNLDIETPKRSRNNGTDTIAYLKEKSAIEMEFRKEELEHTKLVKQEELSLRRDEQKSFQEQMRAVQNQQQQIFSKMSEQQNTTTLLIQQQMQSQQQQQAALLALFEKFVSK